MYICHQKSDNIFSQIEIPQMKEEPKKSKSGRGARINVPNRFDKFSQTDDQAFWFDVDEEEEELSRTQFIKVYPKTILNKVTSPDVFMVYSLNPYQGCEHGCTYCYARPTHNYWGYSAGVDFEEKILYKPNAAQLLRETFDKKSWKGEVISLSGNTDCYQPVEKRFGITREILQVCLDYRNPVTIITKNALILKDADILTALAQKNLVSVAITINTMDESLRRQMEPRTASTAKRFETIRRLTDLKIPVMLMVSPIIPSINDRDVLEIMQRGSEAGALSATYIIVRLNGDVATVFKDWLETTFPDRADRVMHQIQHMHGGSTEDFRFSTRMKGQGAMADMIRQQFMLGKNKFFKDRQMPALDSSLFRRFDPYTPSLFDEV